MELIFKLDDKYYYVKKPINDAELDRGAIEFDVLTEERIEEFNQRIQLDEGESEPGEANGTIVPSIE